MRKGRVRPHTIVGGAFLRGAGRYSDSEVRVGGRRGKMRCWWRGRLFVWIALKDALGGP